jgi:methylenetetrahydrofolate dehydrogenase (NADP+)/methenyltetrahydrofolate cyclohydrolase
MKLNHPLDEDLSLETPWEQRMPKVLDGALISSQIKQEVAEEVKQLAGRGVRPGLAAVLVGHVPASQIYVKSKVQACADLGLFSDLITPAETVTTEEMLALIATLNAREDVDGILVQLPLPKQVDAKLLLDAIDPAKDVDGFHPLNAGRLASGLPGLAPCTPLACILLAKTVHASLASMEAVVIGRSNIVGKPVAQLLLAENATVTVAHSKTRDLPAVCRRADLLIAAIGRPEMIRGDWIKPGATVIDVGINRVAGEGGKPRIVGDVAYTEAAKVAGALTPVPGGVGPMTIACLLLNTLRVACAQMGLPAPNI